VRRVGRIWTVSDDRIDALSKAAASASSRRQLVKVLGGVFGGALLSGGLAAKALGKKDCADTGFPCEEGKDCCGNKHETCCCSLPKNGVVTLCMDPQVCVSLSGTCGPKHA
jgi:hypothetical protein